MLKDCGMTSALMCKCPFFFSSPSKSQAPPSAARPKCYGITDLVSEDHPKEADLVRTTKLIECMKSFDVIEDDLERDHRYDKSFPIMFIL